MPHLPPWCCPATTSPLLLLNSWSVNDVFAIPTGCSAFPRRPPAPRGFLFPLCLHARGHRFRRRTGQHLAIPLHCLRQWRWCLPDPLHHRPADRRYPTVVPRFCPRSPLPRQRATHIPTVQETYRVPRLGPGGHRLLHHHLLCRHHRLGRVVCHQIPHPGLG